MTRLFVKLAFSGLRRRRLQAALTVIVVAGAAATLTLALGVGSVADRPWERTFDATRGAHVIAVADNTRVDVRPVERLPGVVDSSGDIPFAFSTFRDDGKLFGLRVMTLGNSKVERPIIERGRLPRTGEVLVERSFADFKGFRPGDRIIIGAGVPVTVSGIAVIAMGEAYPETQPGLVFTDRATLARIEPNRSKRWHAVAVRLADPATSSAFVRLAQTVAPGAHFSEWTQERADASNNARGSRVVLSIYAVLLLLAGGFVLATLIGGRVLAQAREIALLKAAGLKPGQVSAVFLIEQLALALVATAVGITVGTLITPLFVTRTATLLNASEVPSVDFGRIVVVAAFVLVTVALFTFLPSWRAGRRTTAAALTATAGASRRSRLGRLAQRWRLPLPATLGARDAFAHPGRSTLTALCLALTVASLVATLGMEASFKVATNPPPAPPLVQGVETPAWDPVDDDAGEAARLRPIVYGLDGVLLFVGLLNLLATILLSLRERVRDLGVLKAVGLTPRQVTAGFLASQTVLGVLAIVIGIPLGLALFRIGVQASGGADEFAYPDVWWVAGLVPTVLAAVLLLSAPLAQRAAAIPVTDSLRYE
jgi:putative ABC transport system permease protein